jgi:hypothetical protein
MANEEMVKRGIVKYEAPPIDKLPLPLQVLVRARARAAQMIITAVETLVVQTHPTLAKIFV